MDYQHLEIGCKKTQVLQYVLQKFSIRKIGIDRIELWPWVTFLALCEQTRGTFTWKTVKESIWQPSSTELLLHSAAGPWASSNRIWRLTTWFRAAIFSSFSATAINTIWEKYGLNCNCISRIANLTGWYVKNCFSVAPFKYASIPRKAVYTLRVPL